MCFFYVFLCVFLFLSLVFAVFSRGFWAHPKFTGYREGDPPPIGLLVKLRFFVKKGEFCLENIDILGNGSFWRPLKLRLTR